jgi:hypothetical protein
VPIIITEHVGVATDNAEGMQYRFIDCPWCEKPQGFRFTSTEHCSDCNRAIIDALKLMLNIRYRTAYHKGLVSKAGIWIADPLNRRF